MSGENLKELKDKLRQLLLKDALKKGEFTLSSGKTSNYYLDGRIITLAPEGAYLTASIILEMIKDKGITAIGGPTLGADPIAGAVAALSHAKGIGIKAFIIRKTSKTHGTQRRVEGPELKKGSKVILVDDVATTGGSLIEAKQALEELGVIADEVIVIVDRCEGAEENLAKEGIKLSPIFRIEELGV